MKCAYTLIHTFETFVNSICRFSQLCAIAMVCWRNKLSELIGLTSGLLSRHPWFAVSFVAQETVLKKLSVIQFTRSHWPPYQNSRNIYFGVGCSLSGKIPSTLNTLIRWFLSRSDFKFSFHIKRSQKHFRLFLDQPNYIYYGYMLKT